MVDNRTSFLFSFENWCTWIFVVTFMDRNMSTVPCGICSICNRTSCLKFLRVNIALYLSIKIITHEKRNCSSFVKNVWRSSHSLPDDKSFWSSYQTILALTQKKRLAESSGYPTLIFCIVFFNNAEGSASGYPPLITYRTESAPHIQNRNVNLSKLIQHYKTHNKTKIVN